MSSWGASPRRRHQSRGIGGIAVAAFLLVVLVANYTSEGSAGMRFAAVSILTITTAICTLGTDTGLARFALRYESQGRYGDVIAAVRVAATPVGICVAVLSSAMFASAEVLAPALGLGDKGGATLLRVTALVLPFATANDLALAATRAFGKMRPTVAVDSFLRSILQVGGVIAAGSVGATAAGLAGAWMFPYVVSGLIALVVAGRLIRRRSRGWPSHDPGDHVAVRRESGPTPGPEASRGCAR